MDFYKDTEKLHSFIKIILGLNILVFLANLAYGWIENDFNYFSIIGNGLISIALILKINSYNKTKKELN